MPLIIFFLLTCFKGLWGQIVVQDVDPYSGNLNAVLEQYFFGEGIEVSNAQFKGVDVQFGVFTGAENDLGFDEGIVLSTGRVKDVVGLNDTASSILTGQPNRVDIDADLKQLADFMVDTLDRIHTGSSFERVESMIEAAILEFDISTYGTELSFDYIFGSEEYSAWINTRFVDVMGIFVSGPGINGPYSNNAINIAELPGGRLPLSVSSVHGGNANYPPFNEVYFLPTTSQNIAFGGITTPLNNKIAASPCSSYHVKIAIADGSLPDKDSGIFLKKQGLNTNHIKARLLEQAAVSFPDSLYQEGCALVGVELQLPDVVVSTTYFQNFAFGSVADDLDINYETSFTQRAFETIDTVYYALNYDPLVEGVELAKFELKNTSGCVISSKPIEFYLQDRADLAPDDPENDTLYYSCENAGLTLSVGANYKNDLRYTWSANVPFENRNDSTVYITPQNEEEQFEVEVRDTCSQQSFNKIFVIIKIDSDPVSFIFEDSSPNFSCAGEEFLPSINVQGGTLPFLYSVRFEGKILSDSIINSVRVNQDARYVLEIVDACGQRYSDSLELRVPDHSPLHFSVSAPSSICPNEEWLVVSEITGGDGNYTTSYNGLVYQTDTLRIVLEDEFSFVFEAMDGCGQSVVRPLEVSVDAVSADFDLNYLNDNAVQCVNFSANAVAYEWRKNGDFFSTESEPTVVLGIDEALRIMLTASSANGCSDTLSKSIEPAPRYYIPSAFSPDNDGINDCFQPQGLAPEEYELIVMDRWGQQVFSTTDWSECWNGQHPDSGEIITGVFAIKMFVRYKNLKNTYTGIVQIVR